MHQATKYTKICETKLMEQQREITDPLLPLETSTTFFSNSYIKWAENQ